MLELSLSLPVSLSPPPTWGPLDLPRVQQANKHSVSDKTPNHMVVGETGRYPLYIDSTISSLRYWFKLSKMPMTRFPKQALVMDTNTTHKNRNCAGSIKDCLESYGFHDVWTNGRVENEKAFLSAFKQRMIERFKQEWFTKKDFQLISHSNQFTS